jgi:biopolymer transport protein ExbD
MVDPKGSDSPSDGSQPYPGWPVDVRAKDMSLSKKKSKRGKRKHIHTPPISITSLTDMVTVLLVYLLKTFATNPVEVKDSSVELPRSTCVPDFREMKWAKENDLPPRDGCGDVEQTTIVMITGPQRKESVNGQSIPVPNTPRIAVNSDAVVELDAATYRVPESQKDPASGGWVIAPLREALRKAKEIRELTAQRENKKFDGKVVILADKQTPYRVLSEVLVTCGDSGFADFRFAVIKPD